MTTTTTNNQLEATLWATADKLRGHLDAADYKHVVLGLIFLKYISDAFTEHYEQLHLWTAEPSHPYYIKEASVRYTVTEDRDEYTGENIFWVPPEARWPAIQAKAKDPAIGLYLDQAMTAIERDNPTLKGVLPQNYGREDLDKRRLGELIDLIGSIGLGDKKSRAQDILGRVYEYFLGQFASAEGKKGGQFYTPQSIVQLLVEMLQPYQGRIYDPCCGSGGMFVSSEKFVESHGGRIGAISVFGQESNPTTWRLCKMNLAIRGIDNNLGPYAADSFHTNLHPDLKADYILANPPFNMSDWGGALLTDDIRWRYGKPSTSNANYAWIQHILHHLAATGRAGFVLANGSMSSNSSNEGEIRRAIVDADLVDCMVALPPQLFYNTQIPACLWFLSRAKPAHRHGQTLFIDARNLGHLTDRTRRELSQADIETIASAYHTWRTGENTYQDVAGFCKTAKLADIASNEYILTPGRYVGATDIESDGEPIEEKLNRLSQELSKQFSEARHLEEIITANLKRLTIYG